jgi:hypothetical protein
MSILPNSSPYGKQEARSPRRQRQVRHLHRCGPRCVLEALLAPAVNQTPPSRAIAFIQILGRQVSLANSPRRPSEGLTLRP